MFAANQKPEINGDGRNANGKTKPSLKRLSAGERLVSQQEAPGHKRKKSASERDETTCHPHRMFWEAHTSAYRSPRSDRPRAVGKPCA
jgi:hypothetical protein